MNKTIQVPAQMVGCTPLSDGGMSLRFHTRELTAQEKLLIMNSFQRSGWLLFREDEQEFTELDLPKENSGYEDGKTPSTRLRGILFRYWEQFKSKEEPDFETFYRRAIELIIQKYKEKLI